MVDRKPSRSVASDTESRLIVCGAMLSHPGLVREKNEDTVVYQLPPSGDLSAGMGLLALVADGMGGHASGEVASQIVAQTLHSVYYQQDQPAPAALAEGFAVANKLVFERGASDSLCAGMGTTCTALAVRGTQAWVGHVGDSRAYIAREGRIFQVTEDHSVVAQLVRDGVLSADAARESPDRNVILRAVGVQATVQPVVWTEGLPLRDGDVLMLSSDGLHDLVDNQTILLAVTSLAPFEACQSLVAAALAAGGSDNVSVGVFAFSAAAESGPGPARPTRPIAVSAAMESRR